MREWSLGPGDPLSLVLAADFRLSQPDYINDQIWELDAGSGEPPALALRTTYGLRARSMRLFPRFTENGKSITDPAQFAAPPVIHRVYPNFLSLTFSPLKGVDVNAEYWIPSSQVAAGRLTITNHDILPHPVKLDWIGQLIPINGQPFSPIQMQSVTVLAGKTENLAPIVFITGGPQPGPGPYPSLMLGVDLLPGSTRTLTWVHAALGDHQTSFDVARRTAARPWDGERGRIEIVNHNQMVDITTGDPDWDAALALSQKTAFGLFFPGGQNLPSPSYVLARNPDQGFSRRGDGFDYTHLWNGQSPLETYYLSTLLPGAPHLAKGMVQNFLAAQDLTGEIDCKPGIGGQRGKFLAAPLLATLAWKAYLNTRDRVFLAGAYPRLLAYFRAWLSPAHDRDGDSIPEWTNALQTGFEDNPLFDAWHPWAQGAEISVIQSPTLASMLYREARTLVRMAEELDITEDRLYLKTRAGIMRAGIDACWDAELNYYRYTDRDTKISSLGKVLSQRRFTPQYSLQKNLKEAARLLIRIQSGSGGSPRPEMTIHGRLNGQEQVETLPRGAFQWMTGGAVATSQRVYDSLGTFEISGLERRDTITIQTLDLTGEDHTLFLPLWAEIPNQTEAGLLVQNRLLAAEHFFHPFGIPALPLIPDPNADPICLSVHLPWNQLIGEGLIAYGFRQEAAMLVTHLMSAVVQNLKRACAFYTRYHAESGLGMGERNALAGLAPVGLFLQSLGVQILSPERIRLSGENPFPWTVTVKYKGLVVTRSAGQTEVIFPSGQSVTVTDPTNAEVVAK
jgi:hypothetical protein